MSMLLSYIKHLSYEILKHYVWYSWKYDHLSSGITTRCPANQSDAKLLEGGVHNHTPVSCWVRWLANTLWRHVWGNRRHHKDNANFWLSLLPFLSHSPGFIHDATPRMESRCPTKVKHTFPPCELHPDHTEQNIIQKNFHHTWGSILVLPVAYPWYCISHYI